MSKNPTRYSPRSKPLPVWFVDPMTGEFIELNMQTVQFKKEKA